MVEPVTILPDGIYDDAALHEAIGLTAAALSSARRTGGLRYLRQGHRTLYLGRWLLSWMESHATSPTAYGGPEVENE
jgi:hypothetical protein